MQISKLALFGEAIAHSYSPIIHQQFAQQCAINLSYERISVTTDNFFMAWQAFVSAGGSGANITMPCKRQAYLLCTQLSPAAQLAQSVNTIKILSSTVWYGDNTDGVGLLTDLTNYYHYPLAGKNILLLGAGAAASSIVAALTTQYSCQITVANRTLTTAQQLAKRYKNIFVCDFSGIPRTPFDYVINAAKQLPLEQLTVNFAPQAVAYDTRYNQPCVAEFNQWAEQGGAQFIHDGYGMLLEQAAAAFNIWFAVVPRTLPLRQHLNGIKDR